MSRLSSFLYSSLFSIAILFSGELSEHGGEATGLAVAFNGEYTEGLPIFSEIKGRGPITDEHAQAAVGAAVKYQLLPSVILSQLGYESAYGQSQSGRNDTNFLGLPGFLVVPTHKVLHVELVVLKVVSI